MASSRYEPPFRATDQLHRPFRIDFDRLDLRIDDKMCDFEVHRLGDSLDIDHVRDFTQGAGGYTGLFECRESRQLVVFKVIKNQQNQPAVLAGEVRMLVETLKGAKHPNINSVIRQKIGENVTSVMLKYCNGGDLLDYSAAIHNLDKRKPSPPILLLHFVESMANALAYLHLNLPPYGSAQRFAAHDPVIHADIKLNNIFLEFSEMNRAGLPQIVLGDFGMSTTEQESIGFGGTPGYMAPELERLTRLKHSDPVAFQRAKSQKHITRKADMYAFGVCLFRLMTKVWRRSGEYAERVPRDRELTFHINSSGHGVPNMAEVVSIMKKCLKQDRDCRLTATQLYEAVPVIHEQLEERIAKGEILPPRENLPDMLA